MRTYKRKQVFIHQIDFAVLPAYIMQITERDKDYVVKIK